MAAGLNYKQYVYKGKVTRLGGYVGELEGILDDFKKEKGRLREFWDDAEADSYQRTINSNIIACERSLYNTRTTIKYIESMIEEMEGAEKDVDEYIDLVKDAAEAINKLIPSGE